jgi:hypothetical protein
MKNESGQRWIMGNVVFMKEKVSAASEIRNRKPKINKEIDADGALSQRNRHSSSGVHDIERIMHEL